LSQVLAGNDDWRFAGWQLWPGGGFDQVAAPSGPLSWAQARLAREPAARSRVGAQGRPELQQLPSSLVTGILQVNAARPDAMYAVV
jgi:hypothetical protein